MGGIPCQPHSVAGSRRGMSDERNLWPDFWRITRQIGASALLIENVRGFLRSGLPVVLEDVAAAGWDAEWTCLRASDVGAPHRRERVFLLAWRAGSALPDALGDALRDEPERGRVPHDRPSRGTPSLETWAKGWRTPTATDWKGESARKWQTRTDGDTRPRLSDQVACWPTPTAQDASSSGSRNAPGSRAHKGVSLSDMVTTGGSAGRRGLTTPRDGSSTSQRAALSPRFVEALMGFADAWTDCEDSATRSCPRRASAQSASS